MSRSHGNDSTPLSAADPRFTHLHYPMKRFFYIIFTLIATPTATHAEFNPFGNNDDASKTEATLISEVASTTVGETFTVAIKLKHPDGWHSYYKNPGGPGLPLEFEWKLPEGYTLKNFHWPTPHLYNNGGIQFYVYEGEYVLLADIVTPDTAKAGDQAKITVTPSWQLCDEKGCDPPESKELSISVPVAEKTQPATSEAALFKLARSHLPIANTLWDISTEITTDTIILHIKAKEGNDKDLGKMHFIDDSRSTHAEKKQTLTQTTEGGYTLSAPRDTEKKVPNPLNGLLVDENHKSPALILTLTRDGEQTAAEGAGAEKVNQELGKHGSFSEAPTAAMIAEAAKLYDVDKKIDYILLDGSKEKELNFLTALGFIFIGGFLLNLMPCVFPVLGIKVMGFAQQAGSEPKKIKIHGLVFMAGLVVSMWVLAGIIYTFIYVFDIQINWGEQLTDPVFLAAMIVLFYLFGLNMAGVFEVGTSLTGAGGNLQAKKGYSGSFFSGVLTTLIATPCSGPFLGSVMGYTLKQPAALGMIIFTVFALGISVPYVVLAFLPKLINKLPRPGAWMVTFKQLMAFALFATAAYFFQSFAKITGAGAGSSFLMAIVVLGLGAWAYGRFTTPMTSKVKKYIWGYGFPLLMIVGAYQMTTSAASERAPAPPLTGSSWYPGVVEQNRAKKRIVWVDYTADW